MPFIPSIILGILFGIAFAWPIHRLSIQTKRKINRYGFLVDILVGGAMVSFALKSSTLGGMVLAVVAAVTFTAYMAYSKWSVGTPQQKKTLDRFM